MLVDNAIVVLESVTRCRDEGDPPLKAAVRGVREVGSAVTASTLTTIAVFAPIVFVEGVAGQVFGDQALAVVSSLLVSLAVALFLIPGLAARFEFGEGKRDAKDLTPLLPRWRAFWGRGKGRWRTLAKNVWTSPRFKLRATLSLASFGLWMGLNGLKSSTLAPYATQLAYGGLGIPEEITSKAALYGFLAFLFLIPFLWMLGGTFMRSIGGILADLSGLFGAAIHTVGGLALIPLGLVLKPLAASVAWVQESLEDRYPHGLRRALQHPGKLLGIVGLVCIITIQAAGGLGKELLPEVKQGELTAEIFYSTGMPLEETDWETARLERRIQDIPGVASTAAVAGADRESLSTEEDGPHVGRITLQIEESERRRELEVEVEANIRALLSQGAAIERFEIRRPTLLALKSLLEIEILCEDLETLDILNQEVQQKLHGLPGLVDLRSSIRPGSPEVRIHLDRQQLAQHNLDLSQVASRLRLAVEGEVSTNFSEFDERLDVRVRADSQHMGNLAQLKAMPVNPDAERPLPLEAVASFEMGVGPAEIRHVGSRRAAVLSANISGNEANLGTLSENIEAILAELKLPANTSLQLGGQKQEMDEALRSLQFALLLALFLVYAVMAAQFESLLQPLVILFSVPLAGIGAIWALRITGTSLSVVALLGAVVLAGIVVNNAIVLVDRINRNRDQGIDLHEAILQAGQARLRPILMTTFTTVLGMIPLTGWLAGLPLVGGIGGAEGTELRAPMALVVIAGLLTSTLLTLIVIPVVYSVVARLAPRPETSA